MQVVMRSPKRKRPAEEVLPTGRHLKRIFERDKGFEPSTLSLGIEATALGEHLLPRHSEGIHVSTCLRATPDVAA